MRHLRAIVIASEEGRPRSSLAGRKLLAILGGWLLASGALGGITFLAARAISPEWGREPRNVSPIIIAEVYAAFVGVAALLSGRTFFANVALRSVSLRSVLVAFPAWALAYATAALAHVVFNPLIGPWSGTVNLLRATGSDDGRLAQTGPVLAMIILVRACALAPLGEELLFRGALFNWLRQHLSARWTIGITAALFAMIHGFLPLLPLAFMLGVAAGTIRERSGSTIPTIVVHVVHNILMVAFSYATTGWSARLPPWGHP